MTVLILMTAECGVRWLGVLVLLFLEWLFVSWG